MSYNMNISFTNTNPLVFLEVTTFGHSTFSYCSKLAFCYMLLIILASIFVSFELDFGGMDFFNSVISLVIFAL